MESTVVPMPLRLKPCDGESVYGYLIRFAEAYGFSSPKLFWTALTSRYGDKVEDIRFALELTENEQKRLRGPGPAYCGLTASLLGGLRKEDVCYGFMRWCPDCLRSTEYSHASWSVKFACICPKHGKFLLDRCPECGRVQRLERACMTRCPCGANLKQAQSMRADYQICRVQRLFAASVAGRAKATFPDLTAPEWVLLFRFVAVSAAASGNCRTGQPPGLQSISEERALSEQLSRLLRDWPKGFHALLLKIQAQAKPSFSLAKTFGRLYRWLYVELAASAFQFLRDALEGYLNKYWRGPVCRRNRRIRVRDSAHHGRTTIRSLARSVGASPSLVKRLCQSGQIEATVVVLPSGRKTWSIPVTEVRKVSNFVSDGMNLAEVASHLGLPKRRTRELLAAGSIHSVIKAGKGLASEWLLSRREVDSFARGCIIVAASIRSRQSESVVAMRTVLKAWRLESGEFPSLLSAIQRGDIRCFKDEAYGAQLGDLLLHRESLHHWRESRQLQSGERVSIDTAARILGVKQEVAYQLVRRKVLGSRPMKVGSAVRRISMVDIQKFRAGYVSLVELARLRKQSPKAVLESLAVLPAIGPRVDGCRQYFFLRSDFSSCSAV